MPTADQVFRDTKRKTWQAGLGKEGIPLLQNLGTIELDTGAD